MLPIGESSPIPFVLLPWKRFGRNTIAGDTVLNQDFKEFIEALNDNGVRYLVVGGYAVALQAIPAIRRISISGWT